MQLAYAGSIDPPDALVEAITKLEARADKSVRQPLSPHMPKAVTHHTNTVLL